MTSKLLFGYDRLSGNWPFPPALPKPLLLALLREGVKEGWRWVFESELKAGIITSAAKRACPLWYGQKTQLFAGPQLREVFMHTDSLFFTSLKAFMCLKIEHSHNSIDLLLILEQWYNNDYNDDDTAALARVSLQGAFFQPCYRLWLIKASTE